MVYGGIPNLPPKFIHLEKEAGKVEDGASTPGSSSDQDASPDRSLCGRCTAIDLHEILRWPYGLSVKENVIANLGKVM